MYRNTCAFCFRGRAGWSQTAIIGLIEEDMRHLSRKVVLVVAAIATGAMLAAQVSAQSPAADWQAAAGGKMAFDVASVKKNKSESDTPFSVNIPLGPGDYYTPTGGYFTGTN